LNNTNLVKDIAGKSYTCKDLFGTSLDEQPVYIQNFFNKTQNAGAPCVRIDKRSQYTYIKDNGDIAYSFDFDGGNDPSRINTIALANYNSDYKETNFRAYLKDKITELSKAHQSDNY
jgi:hypothetical protein